MSRHLYQYRTSPSNSRRLQTCYNLCQASFEGLQVWNTNKFNVRWKSMLRHKIYKCRTRVILFSIGENSKRLRNYKSGRVIHSSRSSINIILKTRCIFFKNNPNLHTLFAPMTYFHSWGYTLYVLNGILAIEKYICFGCTTAALCHLYLYWHHHRINHRSSSTQISSISTSNSSLFTRPFSRVSNPRSWHRWVSVRVPWRVD
jgi:hypothetical protein